MVMPMILSRGDLLGIEYRPTVTSRAKVEPVPGDAYDGGLGGHGGHAWRVRYLYMEYSSQRSFQRRQKVNGCGSITWPSPAPGLEKAR